MDLANKKLSLINKLMNVQAKNTLEKVEELLVRYEMESRSKESVKAIEKEEFEDLDEFGKSNKDWINKQSMK